MFTDSETALLETKHFQKIRFDIKSDVANKDDKVESTIDNFVTIMLRDPYYSNIRYNVLLNCAEVCTEEGTFPWTDAFEANSKRYIEKYYHIHSKDKHSDALRILFKAREYNPVKDIIESIEWDGVNRCEHFLSKWTKAEDCDYTREVSRLIFAEGITRVMLPGAKCDDVPLLIGRQGGGKSSIVKFLAIHDEYFGEISTFEGPQSIEQMSGKFIMEIPEMAAFTKTKEVEAIKAFVTRQKDSYRKPYDKNPVDLPRRCILIATTNNPNPLTDLSGNRRYYPIVIHSDGYEIGDHEAEIRDYALQCWAEALARYRKGEMPSYARRDLVPVYREKQSEALQDDWRVPALDAYLGDKAVGEFVCCKSIMYFCFTKDNPKDPTPKDSKDIGIMMSTHPEWEKCYGSTQWGRQRGWKKIYQIEDAKEDLPF